MCAERRNSRRWKLVVLGLAPVWAAALVALPGGCGPKEKPTLAPMPVGGADAEVPEGDYRGEALDGLAASLELKAAQLPGQTAEDHRRQMHEFFGDVVQVLPILEGPQPSGAFRQQLHTVQSARDRLAPDAGRLSVDPTIDTGLRGAYAALNSIGRDEPFAGQAMTGKLDELGGKIDELDRVRSVGRPYVAADAARLIAGTVRHMADRIAGRANDTPATNPTETTGVPPGAIDPPKAPTLDPKPAGAPVTPAEATAETPAEEAPAEATPDEAAPAEEMPAEEAPAEETPGEETPAEEAPADETPAEETPAEETPAEEMPAEKADEPAAEADAPAAEEKTEETEPAAEDAEKDSKEDANK